MSTAAPANPTTAPQPTGRPRVQPPKVNDAKLSTAYANFCRVTGTPEELIIDFGLNTQPLGANAAPVDATNRVVMNYFTAKRLLQAIGASVARHEAAFGALEVDFTKRVVQAK